MTSILFQDYLTNWDEELRIQNRKILLLVDNCPAHPNVQLHNIELHFFPLNGNSVLQPMERGVIRNLKQIYRRHMLLKTLESQEINGCDKPLSVLDAINLLHLAWEKIPSQTIRNCFRHAKLIKIETDSDNFDLENELPLREWLTLTNFMGINKFDDYVTADNNVVNSEELTDATDTNIIVKTEIATDDTTEYEEEYEEEEDKDEEENSDEEKFVTTEDALLHFHKLQLFCQQEECDDEVFSSLNKIKTLIQKKYIERSCVQERITDLFVN